MKRRRNVQRILVLSLLWAQLSPTTAWFQNAAVSGQRLVGSRMCPTRQLGHIGLPGSISHSNHLSRLFAKKQRKISRSRRPSPAKSKPPPADASSEPSTSNQIRGLVQNLFSVITHIQNPDLYVPKWADRAMLKVDKDDNQVLAASTSAAKGDILSLYPMHALGLRTFHNNNDNNTRTRDFVVFDDNDVDGPYFRAGHIREDLRVSMPLLFLTENDKEQEQSYGLFVDVNPTRSTHLPGWMGHLADHNGQPIENDTDEEVNKGEDDAANCIILHLPGVAPLCALVATKDIAKEEQLVATRDSSTAGMSAADLIQPKYAAELSEIQGYLKMAYPAHLQLAAPSQQQLSPDRVVPTESLEDDTLLPSTDEVDQDDFQNRSFHSPFHTIDVNYPGLHYVHRDPDVLVIDDFLSINECKQIIQHADKHLIPCLVKYPETGKVMQDPSRTSDNANLPQTDVPSIVDKLVRLTQCPDASYLETLQVLRYSQGQHFAAHTDGFDGPTTACGFHQSGRLVTIFCYLNTVPEGGTTVFPQLRTSNGNDVLVIAPRQGMAVVHFPATTGFEDDPRTEHIGSEAKEGCDKWLLTTWMWADPRTDPQYDESVFPSLFRSKT